MTVIITPGAFTRPSSFVRLADRLGAQVVARPARRMSQLEVGGLRSIGRALDGAIRDAPDDGTPLVLLGHSMGGLLTLRAGLTHRIDAQVLLKPAPPEGVARPIAGLLRRDPASALKFAALSVSPRLARAGSAVPPRGLYTTAASPEIIAEAEVHRAAESWSALAEMLVGTRTPVRTAEIPTLVVGGTQDGLIPAPVVRRLAERLEADYLELDVAHNFSEEPAGIVVEDAVESWLAARELLAV